MATTHCWMLTQSMPSRYQLTLIDGDPENQPKPKPSRTDVSKSTGSAPLRKAQSSCELKLPVKKQSQTNRFPARKSKYLEHVKSQAFVNTVRINMLKDDGTIAAKFFPRRTKSAPFFSAATLRKLNEQKGTEKVSISPRKCHSAIPHQDWINNVAENSSDRNSKFCENVSRSSSRVEMRRSYTANRLFGRYSSVKKDRYSSESSNSHGTINAVLGFGIKPPVVDEGPALCSSQLKQSNGRRKSQSAPIRGDNRKATSGQTDILSRERMDYDRQTGDLLKYYSSKEVKHTWADDTDVIENVMSSTTIKPRGRILFSRMSNSAPSTRVSRDGQSDQFPYPRYYSRSTREGLDGAQFMIISRQSVLHVRRGFQRSSETREHSHCSGGGGNECCACSLCQSELNIKTSRLSLSAGEDTKSSSPRPLSKPAFWYNPCDNHTQESDGRPNSICDPNDHITCSDEHDLRSLDKNTSTNVTRSRVEEISKNYRTKTGAGNPGTGTRDLRKEEVQTSSMTNRIGTFLNSEMFEDGGYRQQEVSLDRSTFDQPRDKTVTLILAEVEELSDA